MKLYRRILCRAKKIDYAPAAILILMTLLWALMSGLTGTAFAGRSAYNTYTLQALAWRDGRTALWRDYPALELAIFEGRYYVSFPPLPSVILLPFTFLFGDNTPDNLLVKLYAFGAALLMYYPLRQKGVGKTQSALLAVLYGTASSLLPMTLQGAVWYHAQVLGFFLSTAAVSMLAMDRMGPGLFLCALSVACRPFNALYLIPIFVIYFEVNLRARVPFGEIVRRLVPGVALGLAVAAAIALYNYARFGDVFEFGHNYLPEFSFQGGVQFSLSHVPANLKRFLLGLPLRFDGGEIVWEMFGYSALIACPTIAFTLFFGIKDIVCRRMTFGKAAVLVTMLAHFFLLLLHRTFGGYQLGARYCADLIPYTFLYQLLRPQSKKVNAVLIALLILSLVFTCAGTVNVHI